MLGTELAGRYTITAELGRGGMGVVYRARDPLLDRDVAIKVIAPATLNEESEERFRREAQLVGKVDHPSIVPIYDFGRHDQLLFLVMPVLPGTSLRAFLIDKSLHLGEVVEIGLAPALFSAAACLSTHWPAGGKLLVDDMAAHLPPPGAHRLDFDYGTATLDALYEPYQLRFDEHLRQAGYIRGEDWITLKFEGAEHNEAAWRQRVDIPQRFLLSHR